jgi:hypothetical protein
MQPTANPNDIATVPPAAPPPAPPPPAAPRLTIEQLALLGPMAADDRRIAWVNSLVDADIQRQSYATDLALARQFATSGKFDDLKDCTQEQGVATAMVKIMLGRGWGFNAADSIRYIYFTNGRPAIENELVAAKLQAHGYYWDVEWLEDTGQHKGKPIQKCVGCRLWVKKVTDGRLEPLLDRNGKPVSVAFTEADADQAMIWEKGKQIPLSEKWNFKSWARDMYYWKAISRVKKYHAPHVLRGATMREEALEVMPVDAPPPQMPAELPEAPPQPETLAEKILAGKVAPAEAGKQDAMFPEG